LDGTDPRLLLPLRVGLQQTTPAQTREKWTLSSPRLNSPPPLEYTYASSHTHTLTLTGRPLQSRSVSRCRRWASRCRDAGPPPRPSAGPERHAGQKTTHGVCTRVCVCVCPLFGCSRHSSQIYLESLLIHQLTFLNRKPTPGGRRSNGHGVED